MGQSPGDTAPLARDVHKGRAMPEKMRRLNETFTLLAKLLALELAMPSFRRGRLPSIAVLITRRAEGLV